MDKARGTELRSGMVSSWKRGPRVMDVLDTDVDGKVSIQGVFDDMGNTTSIKGEFANVLKEDDEDGNDMPSVDEVIGFADDRESREAMRQELVIADINEDRMVSNEEEMHNFLKPSEGGVCFSLDD